MSFKEIVLGEDEEIVVPIPEKEERQEEPTKKRVTTQKVFQIESFLAQGSFNCAHLVKDGQGKLHVLRLAYLFDDENRKRENNKIKRGLQILSIFQSAKELLGPSLLEETSRFRIFPETEENEHVVGNMCKRIRRLQGAYGGKKGNVFALQHVEYLKGGIFSQTTPIDPKFDIPYFFAFSLLWFFSMAQQVFDFRHHDLKADNIVFRRTDAPVQYNFNWDSKLYFHITSLYVPVVIDYDFASVSTTLDFEFRNAVGTLYTGSPDSLLYWIFKYNNFGSPKVYNENALDWWGLGMCILERYVPRLDLLFEKEWAAYVAFMKEPANRRFALNTEPGDWETNGNYLASFFFSCCFAAIFTKDGSIVPPSDWYPHVREFFPERLKIDMTQNQDFVRLRTWAHDPNSDDVVRYILPALLNWNPGRRNLNNEPWRYIEMFHAFAEKTPRDKTFYQYKANPKANKQHLSLRTYPLLAKPIGLKCIGCSKKDNLFVCTCCNQVVCGKDCHT